MILTYVRVLGHGTSVKLNGHYGNKLNSRLLMNNAKYLYKIGNKHYHLSASLNRQDSLLLFARYEGLVSAVPIIHIRRRCSTPLLLLLTVTTGSV